MNELFSKVRDTHGRFRTESLFYELCYGNDAANPVYTLKDYDHEGCKSAKNIYLGCEDPTEWTPAMQLVGSWPHWVRLTENRKIAPYIEGWREELEVLLRSKSIRFLVNSESGADRKWIAEGKWLSTKERNARLKGNNITKRIDAEIADDLERITLN